MQMLKRKIPLDSLLFAVRRKRHVNINIVCILYSSARPAGQHSSPVKRLLGRKPSKATKTCYRFENFCLFG